MKRLDSCKLSAGADSVISGAGEDAGDSVDEMPADEAGADTAETLAGILGIEQTSVFLQNKKD